MDRTALLELAKQHRDAWAEELRFRLIEHIYADAHNYLDYELYKLEDDVSDEEHNLIAQMMEESIQVALETVNDVR